MSSLEILTGICEIFIFLIASTQGVNDGCVSFACHSRFRRRLCYFKTEPEYRADVVSRNDRCIDQDESHEDHGWRHKRGGNSHEWGSNYGSNNGVFYTVSYNNKEQMLTVKVWNGCQITLRVCQVIPTMSTSKPKSTKGPFLPMIPSPGYPPSMRPCNVSTTKGQAVFTSTTSRPTIAALTTKRPQEATSTIKTPQITTKGTTPIKTITPTTKSVQVTKRSTKMPMVTTRTTKHSQTVAPTTNRPQITIKTSIRTQITTKGTTPIKTIMPTTKSVQVTKRSTKMPMVTTRTTKRPQTVAPTTNRPQITIKTSIRTQIITKGTTRIKTIIPTTKRVQVTTRSTKLPMATTRTTKRPQTVAPTTKHLQVTSKTSISPQSTWATQNMHTVTPKTSHRPSTPTSKEQDVIKTSTKRQDIPSEPPRLKTSPAPQPFPPGEPSDAEHVKQELHNHQDPQYALVIGVPVGVVIITALILAIICLCRRGTNCFIEEKKTCELSKGLSIVCEENPSSVLSPSYDNPVYGKLMKGKSIGKSSTTSEKPIRGRTMQSSTEKSHVSDRIYEEIQSVRLNVHGTMSSTTSCLKSSKGTNVSGGPLPSGNASRIPMIGYHGMKGAEYYYMSGNFLMKN